MSRVNVGVDPKNLADQHLVAESVEITMIVGVLRKNKFVIKSEVPDHFKLGKGHMNFFKTKIVYLNRRLKEVNEEMVRRGFKPGTKIDFSDIPKEFQNDWEPTQRDCNIISERIVSKLNGKNDKFWRWNRERVSNEKVTKLIKENELYFV